MSFWDFCQFQIRPQRREVIDVERVAWQGRRNWADQRIHGPPLLANYAKVPL